jgi:hypothetical protein
MAEMDSTNVSSKEESTGKLLLIQCDPSRRPSGGWNMLKTCAPSDWEGYGSSRGLPR